MYTVLSVFGTRPEAVKMLPLVLTLNSMHDFASLCCVTAQHREMLDGVLEAFNVKPDFDLDIMEEAQTLSGITSKTLLGMENLFRSIHPDLVLVHGDTSTAFAAALSAFYAQIPVGHVEAGLRTYNLEAPYPEEMNRQCVDRISRLHFCPTRLNRDNLESEKIKGDIYITGNTVIDALTLTVKPKYLFKSPVLRGLEWENKRVILLTAHRRENYGKPMENIFRACVQLTEIHSNIEIVYPVHPNPVVRNMAFDILRTTERIHLVEPLDVCEMHNALARCSLVMTDSGGLQEEAPSLGKPVLVLRSETERPEAVEAGTVKIVGVDTNDIIECSNKLLRDNEEYRLMARAVNPYGDGNACNRIAAAILHFFNKNAPVPEEFIP